MAVNAEERRITKNTGQSLAYTFKDPQVGELEVLATENGWWGGESGSVKLQKLIDAWKIDANDDEACFYAGISPDQFRYFRELHPGLSRIKHMCIQNLGLIAKKKFAKQVENGEAALPYLRLKRKNEGYNPRVEIVDETQRAIYDRSNDEFNKLIETLRHGGTIQQINVQNVNITNNNNSQEHPGSSDTRDADAGQDGHGDEAGLAELGLGPEGGLT